MLPFLEKKKINTTAVVDEIEAAVYTWAKPYGFVKHGRTFNRTVDKNITQVINFQNGCPPKGAYGVLWVNLGIRVPECADFPNEEKTYYKEYECNVRCRLDEYVDKKENPYILKDDPQKIAYDIIKKLQEVVLPVFDILSSRKSIIDNLRNYPEFNSFRNHLVDRDIRLIMKYLEEQRFCQ